jgi:H+/Cl- antiporter ClcA
MSWPFFDHITFAGLGIFLAGIGGVLSGWAAIRSIRRRRDEEGKSENGRKDVRSAEDD